ncbi:uncharacterized protein LOC134969871 [Pseudophryne corroboree]|uniref:uncharacterized protein LOC134969871 n=1 Tax=Pseudophryne corroboree TaxID=495146 RepID=UPI00308143DA
MDSLKAHQDIRTHQLGSAEPPASHEEMLDEEHLKEDDLDFLCQLENSSLKRKNHKKKGLKKLQKCEAIEPETETFSNLSVKIESASPLHDSANIGGSLKKKKKRDRKRTTLEFTENCLPQESGNANLAQEARDPSHSSSDGRKRKKKKHQVHFEVSSSGDHYLRDENNRPAPDTFSVSSSSDVTTKPKLKGAATRDTVTSHRKKEPLKVQQSNIAGVVRCSTPFSSPTASSRMTLEDNLGVPWRTEDMNSVSDHSQDLFITQKLFLPARVSSSSSGCSPPLAQEQGRSDSMRLSSQSSGFAHRCGDHSTVVHGRSVASAEKSTQTDGVFSYLELMSFLNKVKVLEACSQEPLDLSLPSRVRAVGDCLNVSDNDVILIESTSPAAARQATKKSKGKRWIPPKRSQESRMVQSVLNSSYFFKGKGDDNENTPITPLIKMKQPSKKRARKSVLNQSKKENYHTW